MLAIADSLPTGRARRSRAWGWPPEAYARRRSTRPARAGTTAIVEDAMAAIAHPATEVVHRRDRPPAGGHRARARVLRAGQAHRHGERGSRRACRPALAARAKSAGIVYSLAYGDQPALICELVDWARAAGFTVVAAGKGTKYLPAYHASTPQTVWGHYGFSEEMVAKGDFNAQMFNSFLDGTKSGIEMAAVANATGLTPAPDGLAFPPCGVDDLPR
jgi:predicted homoserine dehydrogenase-like protein